MCSHRDHLADDQVRSLLPLLHWIPVAKGMQREWLEANAPGADVGQILMDLEREGRIERTGKDFPPYRLVGVTGRVET